MVTERKAPLEGGINPWKNEGVEERITDGHETRASGGTVSKSEEFLRLPGKEPDDRRINKGDGNFS